MKYYLFTAFILLNVCLISCGEKKSFQVDSNKEGEIQELTVYNKDSIGQKIVYSFYENGNVKEIHRYNEKDDYVGEQLWFYSDGLLDHKASYRKGANGNGYFFYDTTGTLKKERYYRNTKQVFHGVDYWEDSLATIKSLIYFNDSGQPYYQKNFDRYGDVIGELGKK
jgi:antitoxin component YwqK of YwqJK toxin-antitoxin module